MNRKETIDSYPYSFERREGIQEGPFSELIQYRIMVPCMNVAEDIDYFFNLYRYKGYLFITDIFPVMWEHDKNCFQRFTSKEGFVINMRKLTFTAFHIFWKHFVQNDPKAAMVISGSYASGEDPHAVSRKLKIYRIFSIQFLQKVPLQMVPIFDLNAFVLMHKDAPLSHGQVKNDYNTFKCM